MINTAIVSFLVGDRNVQLLRSYLTGKPRVVLSRTCDCTDVLREVVEGAGSQLQPLEELLSIADKTRIEFLATEMRERFCLFKDNRDWLNFCEEFALDAGEFWNVVAKTIEIRLTDSISIIEALDIAREKYAIEILVLSEDLTCSPRIVTEWAKFHDIVSLHLPHGMALAVPYTISSSLNAEKMAAFGRRNIESYLDIGISPDRMIVTGNPSWDVYAELKNERADLRKKIWEKYRLTHDAPLIVFGTTWHAALTASSDPDIYKKSLHDFLVACKMLLDNGCPMNIIVKDRENNLSYRHQNAFEIFETVGLPSGSYRYTFEDTQLLVVAADCLVSVDSNLSIEAMMCGTIAINLIYESGLRMGPSFSTDSGILNTVPVELPSVLEGILKDPAMRERLRRCSDERSYYYNIGNVGGSAERVASLMTDMAMFRNPIIAERDSLLQETLRLKLENDSLVQDKFLLTREFETVTNSLSWCLTHPLRKAKRIFKRVMGILVDPQF